jgi:hypothetical protein
MGILSRWRFLLIVDLVIGLFFIVFTMVPSTAVWDPGPFIPEILGTFIGLFGALALEKVVEERHEEKQASQTKRDLLGELKDILENPTYGAIPIFMWEKVLSTGVIDYLHDEDKNDFVYVYGIVRRHQKQIEDDAEILAANDEELFERHTNTTQGLLAAFYIVAERLLEKFGIEFEKSRHTGPRFLLGLLQDTTARKRLYVLTSLQYLRKEDVAEVLTDIRFSRSITETLEALTFEELRLLFSILIRGGGENLSRFIKHYEGRHAPQALPRVLDVLRAAYRVGIDVSKTIFETELKDSIMDGITSLDPDTAKRFLRQVKSLLASGTEPSLIGFKPGADKAPRMMHIRSVAPDYQEKLDWINSLESKVYSMGSPRTRTKG